MSSSLLSRETSRQLAATRDYFRTKVLSAGQIALMDAATERLAISGATARLLAPGQTAPDFILPDVDGRPVRLQDLLGRGPVVLVFYRGAWCPYCNLQLRGLQRALPRLAAHGASLVAVSPQLPDGSLSTREKNDLQFPVLSDLGNRVARAYGTAFELPEELRALYDRLGHGLAQVNGAEGATELPLAATFVITPDGVVARAHADADYTRRLDPDDVVAALANLSVHSSR